MTTSARAALGLWAALAALLAATPQQPATAKSQQPDPTLEQRARKAEAERRLSEAGDLFAQLCKQQPEHLAWRLDAARCLRTAGRFRDALDVLEAAPDDQEHDLDLLAMRASTYHLEAEQMLASGVRDNTVLFLFEEAARIADAALRDHPGHRDLRLILAQSYFQLDRLDKAQDQAEEAARRFPDHPGGHILVAKIAFRHYVGYRRDLQGKKPSDPDYQKLLERAKDARDRATAALERAILADPDRAFPHALFGDVLAWSGNVEQAAVRYQEALSIDPAAAVNHKWLAANTGPDRRIALYEAATEAYRKRSDADPKKAAITMWWQAYALFEKKKFKASYVLFNQVVEANPDYLNSRCYAMLAAYWEGNHDNAELQAARYAAKAPRSFADYIRTYTNKKETVAILEFLATRAFDGNRLPASRDINHVLAMVLDSATHWNNYAFLCRETGQYQASYAAYLDALSLEPDSPQLLNDAAVILQYHLATADNLRHARELYQRAVREADHVLADPEASSDDKVRARSAKNDAQANLKKLGR